ncbi:hypothetical protein [Streptomyces sp. NBC_01190]|uniref:hypothetical protein n=1 Tax=Streptomyces sp. NBC_01190 TaxID=2903767 RepID=UPI00386C8D14|nr:hypothetical protein OG519_29285 [Streptomyces sp. NBC_01190]
MTGWITMAAADAPQATTGTELAGFLICCGMGAGIIYIGRTQRRTGRNFLSPDWVFRFGDALHQPRPERKAHRATGRFFEIIGWVLAVIGICNGLAALF